MKNTIKRILFTTDLSPEAKEVFEYVKKIVASTGASVHVVHIMEEVNKGTEEMLAHFLGEEKWKQFKKEKIEKVESILIGKMHENRIIRDAIDCFLENSNHAQENDCEDKIIIDQGIPSEKIMELAEKNQCELIVAGREKRTVLGVNYLGGTLKDILKKSDIPVLVVPYEKEK
ncbi:MAG: universal stress protein [Pseudomonadota bacterium]